MRSRFPRLAAGSVSAVVVLSALTAATAPPSAARGPAVPAWAGFAGNAQHTAIAPASPQPLDRVHWHVAVDQKPDNIPPDGPIAHYASPMITSANTVVVPTRFEAARASS